MKLSSNLLYRLVLVLTWALPGRGIFAASPARIDFGRDILPVLSDKCYQCHGPDEKARKAKLRFDTKEGAFRLKDGKAVILPHDGAGSELTRRITTTNPDDVMPPPDSNRKLTAGQIDLLKRWIDQGADWGVHWAFAPPLRAEPPATQLKNWARNGIDSFILARLEKEGLKPSPEARKETWLRRVSLDLTGLPPTPAELDAFAADNSPDAHEKVADRLLASPRYGERMAADWLDVARYADTHGYQMDRYRAVWPYRDWVIQAFNRDLPFDQFATWQLAGDLLLNATKEQRLATAFNRLHMQNEEGGIVEEEYRVAYVVDRVNTMGTAFLGLTFECSRCHDHKYDPISQRDFYSLFSMFQNIDESGQTVYFGEVMPVPTLLLSTEEQDARLASLQKTIREREQALDAARSQARGAFEEWLTTRPAADRTAPPAIPGLVGAFSFDDPAGNKAANDVAGGKPGNAVENPQPVAGRSGKAALLNGENGFTFPGVGGFNRADPFSFGLWLQTSNHAARMVVVHKSRAWMDAGSRGYELLLEEGRPTVGLHHMWPGNSIKVRTLTAIPTNRWTHVAVTYDGSSRADGVRLYINGQVAPVEVIRNGLWKDFTYGGSEPDLAIGFRMRDVGFKDGTVDDFRVFDRELTRLEAAQLAGLGQLEESFAQAPARLSAGQREGLFDFYLANFNPIAARHREALHEARREQNRLVTSVNDIMVMQETPVPKKAFVLKRGAYDMRGEEVTADTPRSLPPFPAGQPRNRLGLARWLFAPDHPLTSRVTVNRAWQQMFGRGIVETSDNFGNQGAQPTHPELLDWLAVGFVDGGWDMKRLLKLIALSATYRQSSQPGAELLARDPDNRLLGRAPARRLTSEMLRDQALAASGLLVEKTGGPSVKPYQPEGLWEEIAMGRPHYETGRGEDLHRRSLYTFWKRTVPNPSMITFDSAERNVCTVRRQNTSTPLQALALLNDTQIIEAARLLGERLLKEGGTTLDEQVAWAFRTVTGRRPARKETEVLKALFTEQRALFAAGQQEAAKWLAIGEAVNDPSLNLADLAAGAVLAKAILNHDEAVTRR